MSKTGGSSPNQYRRSINLPLTEDRTQFVTVDVEAMDVISEWDLGFNLGNNVKACLRLGKKDGVSEAYDLEKMVFFSIREMLDRNLISPSKFWELTAAIDNILKRKEEIKQVVKEKPVINTNISDEAVREIAEKLNRFGEERKSAIRGGVDSMPHFPPHYVGAAPAGEASTYTVVSGSTGDFTIVTDENGQWMVTNQSTK